MLRSAYRSLKSLPNIAHININPGLSSSGSQPISSCTGDVRLNIVGDLHGQLPDLIHIIEEAGMPSPTNKYVFNGDFVDRGPHGVEVSVILFAFHAVLPDCVFLNRFVCMLCFYFSYIYILLISGVTMKIMLFAVFMDFKRNGKYLYIL